MNRFPEPLLRQALAQTKDLSPSATNLEKTAAHFGIELTRFVFSQQALRKSAKSKFAQAENMLFAEEALEQASGDLAAYYHASLFPPGVLVTDLTTGIGGDLLRFASRGPVCGFEIDPDRAEIARWNLTNLGLGGLVEESDCLSWLAEARDGYIYADPARRIDKARTIVPENFSPPPALLICHASRQKLLAIKLTPFLQDSYLQGLSDHVQFLSVQGECKEALVLAGSEATGGKCAVHIESGAKLFDSGRAPKAATVGKYIFDSDPAAVRAHALGSLCQEFNLWEFCDSLGYLTGDHPVASVWLRTYRVLYSGTGDIARTKRELSRVGSKTPILKQRGTGLDLEKLRRELKLTGGRDLIVICYLLAGRVCHMIVEPISS